MNTITPTQSPEEVARDIAIRKQKLARNDQIRILIGEASISAAQALADVANHEKAKSAERVRAADRALKFHLQVEAIEHETRIVNLERLGGKPNGRPVDAPIENPEVEQKIRVQFEEVRDQLAAAVVVAIGTLAEVSKDTDADPSSRIRASEALLTAHVKLCLVEKNELHLRDVERHGDVKRTRDAHQFQEDDYGERSFETASTLSRQTPDIKERDPTCTRFEGVAQLSI